jgi:hypothetical protein
MGVPMAKAKKPKLKEELTQENYEDLVSQLEDFQNRFLVALAGTDRFEIIPTLNENGNPLTQEQYTLLKTECSRLGLKILYHVQNKDGTAMYVNSENGKVGYMHDGMH